jgi:hypothetical protein
MAFPGFGIGEVAMLLASLPRGGTRALRRRVEALFFVMSFFKSPLLARSATWQTARKPAIVRSRSRHRSIGCLRDEGPSLKWARTATVRLN